MEIEKIDSEIKKIKDIENLLIVIDDYKKQLDSRKELTNQLLDSDSINNLYEFYLAAEKVITNTRSMGMSLTPCTVPQAGKPSFELEEDEMEVGLGSRRDIFVAGTRT